MKRFQLARYTPQCEALSVWNPHLGNVDEQGRDGLAVVLHDDWEEDGITDSMGEVIEASELVSHGVDISTVEVL